MRDAAEVLDDMIHHYNGVIDTSVILDALAAAAAAGPLTAEVECRTCGGSGLVYRRTTREAYCPTCDGDGTVRYVWHRADQDLY